MSLLTHCSPTPRLFDLDTIGIWGWITLGVCAVLWTGGYLATSLASKCQQLSPICDNHRYLKTLPNVPRGKISLIENHWSMHRWALGMAPCSFLQHCEVLPCARHWDAKSHSSWCFSSLSSWFSGEADHWEIDGGWAWGALGTEKKGLEQDDLSWALARGAYMMWSEKSQISS